ncbi:MAG TPA: HlyD family efflux transporter periplasmic adaptor subunit [Blastocatellia bacterium]|nr:HlyD family efflux transporter periplasmic adaptor subunit [Blastocatellia bacterium]
MAVKTPTDYCDYPPQPAADVEVAEQRDGERLIYVVGSAAVARYLMLRETEYRVFQLLSEALTPNEVCAEFKRRYGGTLPLQTLTKFIAKLDEAGIMAGARGLSGYGKKDQQLTRQPYFRLSLFNPDRLFARLVPLLRWIWTPEFVTFTVLLMLSTLLLVLMNGAEVAAYGGYILREHYPVIIVAALIVVASHEFAHGLTCKAFGGRATEVGVLLVYYFLPALYCNVSGIHLIKKRSRRLWVIAAGVYWQLLVGTVALLAWFFVAPFTLAADVAFIFFFGSILNLAFNANPLIKLDGYYFLSQWLQMPNLMDRSRAFWRGTFRRLFTGERDETAAKYTWRERLIYATFGLLSTLYTIALTFLIVRFAGGYLIESFYLLGLLLTAGVALVFVRRPLLKLLGAVRKMITRIPGTENSSAQSLVPAAPAATGKELVRSQSAVPQRAAQPAAGKTETGEKQRPHWRRTLVPATLALIVIVALCLPWEASVGSYGTLIAIPGQETIIRAPESASLVELKVRPGDQVAGGAAVGRLGNLETDEQLVQVQSELARANADYERLLGELRTRSESAARAELQLQQRERDFEEINNEQKQIKERQRAQSRTDETDSMIASTSPSTLAAPGQGAASYPAAIAVLQADVDLRRARLEEAQTNLDRARRLYSQGLMPRSDLDTVETRASTLAIELNAAREKLEAALIEHRRRHTSTATEMNLARSDVGAEKLQLSKLGGELRAMREIIGTLEEKRNLLRRKQSQFELVTPRDGTVFGEELPRLVGQYFQKGAEICRVADTKQLLVRILVPEREIGDVRIGLPVRLKARAFPDKIFRGTVSRISGESEADEHGQATYRVELTIENRDSLLRPGMTAFARIDFGRQAIGRILLHKVRQALRPELWML